MRISRTRPSPRGFRLTDLTGESRWDTFKPPDTGILTGQRRYSRKNKLGYQVEQINYMDSEEQKLIARIRAAFDNVTLEDGISLNMTEYNDSGGTLPQYKERAISDERYNWWDISDATLEKFTLTFSFTDRKGFRFYIPAYMIWTVRNHRKSDSVIADSTIYAIDPNHYLFRESSFHKWFTKEQIDAMVEFLSYAVRNGDTLHGEVAMENIGKIKAAQ